LVKIGQTGRALYMNTGRRLIVAGNINSPYLCFLRGLNIARPTTALRFM